MKNTKKHTNKELALAHVFPHGLSSEKKGKADEQLFEMRKKRLREMTPDKLILSRIMQLKFTIENYISGSPVDKNYSFAHFLKEYINSLNMKKSDFSKEISLHFTKLSRLLNNREEPGDKIFVRLELHSNNVIPAAYWQRIYEKQKELELLNNKEIRKVESKHVKNNLSKLNSFLGV